MLAGEGNLWGGGAFGLCWRRVVGGEGQGRGSFEFLEHFGGEGSRRGVGVFVKDFFEAGLGLVEHLVIEVDASNAYEFVGFGAVVDGLSDCGIGHEFFGLEGCLGGFFGGWERKGDMLEGLGGGNGFFGGEFEGGLELGGGLLVGWS